MQPQRNQSTNRRIVVGAGRSGTEAVRELRLSGSCREVIAVDEAGLPALAHSAESVRHFQYGGVMGRHTHSDRRPGAGLCAVTVGEQRYEVSDPAESSSAGACSRLDVALASW
ncbi:hypothetical protein ACL02T_30075 [Pseudonocardia sp. RS010]|uniref:hypothetical protein n=1 Tax=Pseudonocardia sp. RS010 TaxID=3385979 RepID=UPI0039A14AD1